MPSMGALRPWHLMVLLCCLLTVTAIVALVVALIIRSSRPKP